MPRLTRRNKVISIRLSDEEYDQLQHLCIEKGADSISELSRAAMKLLLQESSGQGPAVIESRVNEIQDRVSTLDREVARLSSMLGLARLEEQLEQDARVHTLEIETGRPELVRSKGIK